MSDATDRVERSDAARRVLDRTKWLWWLLAAVIAAAVVLFTIPGWTVTYDGSAYLAAAANLRAFEGYVAPDGSLITTRGPGYPAVLALSWLHGGYSSGVALGMSRLVLVGVAGVIAFIAHATTARVLPIFAAGVLAVAHPVVIGAGAFMFSPDGLAVLFVVSAIALVVVARASPRSAGWFVSAGVAGGLIVLTKESHAFLLIPLLGWLLTEGRRLDEIARDLFWFAVGFALTVLPWFCFVLLETGALPGGLRHLQRLEGWVFVAALPAAILALWVVSQRDTSVEVSLPAVLVAVVSAIVVTALALGFGSAPVVAAGELPTATWHVLETQAYPGWNAAAAVGLVALAGLGVWRMRGVPAIRLVWIVTVSSAAYLVYAAWAGTGIRNALALPTLLAILAGVSLGHSARSHRLASFVTAAVVVAVVVGGVAATWRLADLVDVRRLTAESSTTLETARWLEENGDGRSIVGTPMYFQSVWRLGDQQRNVALFPMYAMSREAWDAGHREFGWVYSWIGATGREDRFANPVALGFGPSLVGGQFEEDVVALMGPGGTGELLLLSGNARYPASAADGGSLLLALSSSDAVTPVFVDQNDDAQWVAVFRLSGEAYDAGGPTVLRSAESIAPANGAHPDLMSLSEYSEAVKATIEVLERQIANPTE